MLKIDLFYTANILSTVFVTIILNLLIWKKGKSLKQLKR